MKRNEPKLLKYDVLPNPDLGIHIVHRESICSGPVFEKHWHDHLQFILFEKGETIMHCHQGTLLMRAGDIALVNSGEVHYMDKIDSARNQNSGLDFLILKISPRFLQGRFLQPVVDTHYIFVNRIHEDIVLRQTMYRIFEEYETREVGWEVAIRSHALALIAYLMRHYVDQELSPEASRKQQQRWRCMGTVLEYMEKNMAVEMPLNKLATIACQSESHFCRSFKKLTGFSSREYLLRLRIQKAQLLLQESDKSIAEIGYAVGFSDNNYFSRAFRKVLKCSPRDFKTRFQNTAEKK